MATAPHTYKVGHKTQTTSYLFIEGIILCEWEKIVCVSL